MGHSLVIVICNPVKLFFSIRKSLLFFSIICPTLLCSCASTPVVQPEINHLASTGNYPSAIELLKDQAKSYGPRNKLLYYLDYGLVLHYAKNYEDSSAKFEQAKKIYDDLYTISLTNEFSTWLVNSNRSPYRGEDFERVMINIFEALNYVALGNIEEALVEARDVDETLIAINRQYPAGQK